ncbi:MAG: OmpA family protein [Candidatus Cloacimonetes bacterium]|nr:OmpA family protein [Candidatus Cloacimonadota bacterium]
MNKVNRICFFLLIFSLIFITPAFAQIFQRQIYTGLRGSAIKLIGGEEDDSTVRMMGEFNFGYYITRRVGIELSGGYGFVTVRDKSELLEIMSHISEDPDEPFKTTLLPFSVNCKYNLRKDKNWIPYLVGGLGAMKWECIDTDTDETIDSGNNFMGTIGTGIEWEVSRTVGIDFNVRYQRLFSQTGNMSGVEPGDIQTGNLAIGFGFTCRFGGWRDTDGDGIEDKLDKCPLEPEDVDGYEDEDGCPEFDNDSDGLDDYVETNTGEFINADSTGTDPNAADTDMDGVNDYDEVLTYHTNPVTVDSDSDGLSDGDEINNYKTDPNNIDTDNDGLNDYDEVNTHKTDPTNPDTDGDGVMDGVDKCPLEAENYNGFEDEDGCPDTKPEIVFKKKAPIILDGVNFKVGSSELTDEAKLILGKVVRTLNNYTEMYLEISGHTDNTGSRKLNMKLSRKRAESVRRFLINQGVEGFRLRAIGLGPDHPVTTNKTKEGRFKNRRIEFFRTK